MILHNTPIFPVLCILTIAISLSAIPAWGQLPQVSRQSTSITIGASETSVTVGSSITFSGKLTDQSGNAIPNLLVTIREDNCSASCILVAGMTDAGGSYALTWYPASAETINVMASFAGDLRYQGSQSNDITILVNQAAQPPTTPPSTPPSPPQTLPSPPQNTPPSITITIPRMGSEINLESSDANPTEGDTVTLSGRLTDLNGNGIPNASVSIAIYDYRHMSVGSLPVTTSSDGSFVQTWVADVSGTVFLDAVFVGNSQYSGSTSGIVSLYVSILPQRVSSPQPSNSSTTNTPSNQNFTITIPRNDSVLTLQSSTSAANRGDTIAFSGQLADGQGNGIPDGEVRIIIYDAKDYYQSHIFTVATDSFGNFEQKWVADVSGSLGVEATFAGSGTYKASTSMPVFLYVAYLTPESGAPSSNVTQYNKIPSWIKNNAKWWAQGQIDDSTFLKGVQYLLQQDIVSVQQNTSSLSTNSTQQIPSWIKNNAKWWAEGQISDDEFLKGIQYLVSNGIIRSSS